WFFAYLFIKGASAQARVEDGSFFRFMMPAFPAYFLLAVSIPLLVPTVGPRLAERFPPGPPRLRLGRRSLALIGAVFVLIPFVMAVSLRRQTGATAVRYEDQGTFVAVSDRVHLQLKRQDGGYYL